MPPLLGTEDVFLENLAIHPNPTSDFIEITGLTEAIPYEIDSVTGKLLGSGQAAENQKINLQSLATGVYFLVLDGGQYKRVIKK